MEYKISKEKNSSLEIEITIKNEEFIKNWDKAFRTIQKEIEVEGFRKGLAPENIIISKYGESSILQEMANIAINKSYPELLIKEKLHVIEEPHIHIVNLQKGEDFVYHAHVTVYPVFILPNYKNEAKKITDGAEVKSSEITEEEIQNILSKLSEEVKQNTPNIENLIRENYLAELEQTNKNVNRSKFLEVMVGLIDKENIDMWPKSFQDKDKAQVIALEISKSEKIVASQEEVEAETLKLMMHIPKEDIISGKVEEYRVEAYATQIVINEKMFKALAL